ncbi:MAG: hypothetical protein WA192_00365 [Candidatus Acidiferrales bacterium]
MGLNRLPTRARQEGVRPAPVSTLPRVLARTRRIFCAGVFVVCATSAALFAGASAGAADNGRFLWKSVSQAQCKLDDKVPLAWNIYQTDKKKEANLVLILLGRRYLALDIKAKVAYYVFPADVQAKGAGLESGNLFVASRVLPTSNWTVRDVGPAEMIKLTLGDYGRGLDVELPHMPDMRAFY